MELWIILAFVGALALIGLLFWDAERRYRRRLCDLRRLEKTLGDNDDTTHRE